MSNPHFDTFQKASYSHVCALAFPVLEWMQSGCFDYTIMLLVLSTRLNELICVTCLQQCPKYLRLLGLTVICFLLARRETDHLQLIFPLLGKSTAQGSPE